MFLILIKNDIFSILGGLTSCNEGLVACPQPDGTIKCVADTIGCGKSNLSPLGVGECSGRVLEWRPKGR